MTTDRNPEFESSLKNALEVIGDGFGNIVSDTCLTYDSSNPLVPLSSKWSRVHVCVTYQQPVDWTRVFALMKDMLVDLTHLHAMNERALRSQTIRFHSALCMMHEGDRIGLIDIRSQGKSNSLADCSDEDADAGESSSHLLESQSSSCHESANDASEQSDSACEHSDSACEQTDSASEQTDSEYECATIETVNGPRVFGGKKRKRNTMRD